VEHSRQPEQPGHLHFLLHPFVLPAHQDLHNGAAIVVVVNDVVVVISVAIIEAVVDVVIVIDIVVVVSVADIVAVVDVVIVLDAEGLSTPWHEQQGYHQFCSHTSCRQKRHLVRCKSQFDFQTRNLVPALALAPALLLYRKM